MTTDTPSKMDPADKKEIDSIKKVLASIKGRVSVLHKHIRATPEAGQLSLEVINLWTALYDAQSRVASLERGE